jgi:PAS domain S-box-containing protein
MKTWGRALRVGLLCTSAGLAGAYWAAQEQEKTNARLLAERFVAMAQGVTDGIAANMGRFEFGLRGLRGMVATHEGLPTLSQVKKYATTRNVDQEFPGARGFGLIWRVAPGDVPAFTARMRADAFPDFAIRQLSPNGGERQVIAFIEPLERNRQAIGLDIASEAHRRDAARAAMATGKATITEPITLVQASGKTQRAFLVLLPIYRASADGPSQATARGEALGFSYAPVLIDEVLGTLPLNAKELWFELRDAGSEEPFFRSPGSRPDAAELPAAELEFSVFDRRWTARLRATPAFVQAQHLTSPRAVGGGFSALALLAGVIAFLVTQRAQRDRKLRLEQARRAAIVENSGDAIVGMGLDGSVTEWNPGAQLLFGYAPEEAIGRKVVDLVLPADRIAEDDVIRDRIAAGEKVEAFETLRRHRDGSLIDVSVQAAPELDELGRCIGLTKSFRDIRAAKAAQHALESLNSSLEAQVRERTRELDKTARDLRNIVDALPSMIGYWDKELRNGMANKAYADWFGVDPATLKGRTLKDLLGAELFERNRPFAEAALRGEPQTFERSIPKPDGSGMRHSLAYYLPDVVGGEVRGFYVLVHDVTELQEQRVALEAEKRDKAALLATVDAHGLVSVTDGRGTITAVNDSFCRVSGFTAEELLGQNHRMINSGTHPPEFWRSMWRTVLSGKTWRGEVCNRAKDGSLYWVDSVITPFLGEDKRVDKIISFQTDITELKRLQQSAADARRRAEDSERFLREITDRLPLSLAYLDADRRLRFANATQCERLGTPREAVLDRLLSELADGSAPAREVELLGADAGEHEFEDLGWDGLPRHYGYLVAEDRDVHGQLRGHFVIGTDITPRKRAEAVQLRTLAMLESVLRSATQVSIIAVDRQGKVNLFNHGAERLLGYEAAEVIGTGNAMQWHLESELQARAAALSERLGRHVPPGLALVVPEVLNEPFDCHYRRKDGSLVPVTLSVTEIRDREGSSLGFIGVAYDISSRIEHEAGMQRAVEAAQAASEAKSGFLANMSHEIRTPLNAVIGLAHLLQRTPLSAEQSPYVQNILLSGKALLGIVNDVLDLSKIEAGEMTLERTTFSLRDISSSLQALFGEQARNKGLALAVTPDADLPDALLGDPTRLRQILVNLLGNAIKFTERGQVSLVAHALTAPAGHCRLRFEVRDTGVGIAPEVLPQLFAPFSQADASTTRRFGGTGLGLSITKHLVELMGGQLGVDSTPGQGSCFWVELQFELGDAAQLAHSTQAHPEGPRLQGVRVLLVDDSDINLQVAGRLLELEGAQVQPARDGAEALRWVQQRADFDIVLMDVQMPVMDGLEATRRIRALPERAGLPIVALTAGTTDTEHRRAREAGLQDILSKPIDPELLVQGVRRLLGRAPAETLALTPAPSDSLDWPQIDGIDAQDARRRLAGDVKLMRSMLQRMLALCEECLAVPADAPEQRQELAGLMHKLKGSAATLGAKSIAALAGQVEAACQQGQAQAVGPLRAQLGEKTRQLQAASADWLQASDERPPIEGGAPALDAQRLNELVQALQVANLDGLDLFEKLAPALRPLFDAATFERLTGHMENLEFAQALLVIRRLSLQEVAPTESVT